MANLALKYIGKYHTMLDWLCPNLTQSTNFGHVCHKKQGLILNIDPIWPTLQRLQDGCDHCEPAKNEGRRKKWSCNAQKGVLQNLKMTSKLCLHWLWPNETHWPRKWFGVLLLFPRFCKCWFYLSSDHISFQKKEPQNLRNGCGLGNWWLKMELRSVF